MPTADRQRINSVKRLHEIRKQVFSSSFDSLSKQELSSLRNELNEAIGLTLESGLDSGVGIVQGFKIEWVLLNKVFDD